MFKELKRVVYQAEDLEAAKGWYRQVLGAEPLFDAPVACIFQVNRNSLTVAKGAAPGAPGEGRVTAYWEVDDVDRAFARLVELGARPKAPPSDVLTLRVAQVTDPFGNVLGLCGPLAGDPRRTIEREPSQTAQAVALCRALLAREEREELRRPDPFSERFLEPEVRAALDDAAGRRALVDRRLSRPLYDYFAARTAFVDEAFRGALRAGLPQIVFLGAGYDTRALRFAAELGATRIFELDAPTTQGRKRALLEASRTALPAQLRFVPVDFRTERFVDRLAAAGFDAALPTLFVWEGVTYYLTQETVDRTIDLLQGVSAPGSELVLDYMTAKVESVNAGEPFLSFQDPATVPGWLARFGFRVEEELDADRMAARYLTLRDGAVAGRPFGKLRLLRARR